MTCKPVRIKGTMRRLCWGPKRIPAHTGVAITSNTSIGGGGKPKKPKKAAKKGAKKGGKKRAKKSLKGWW